MADPSPIVSSVAHLQRCENPPCEATHNNNTPHRSAPAHTPTCRSKKLASTPPELAGACAAAPAPRPRRPAGQRLSLRLGGLGAPGVPIWHRGAGRPPEQGRCALHRARGGGAHRAGRWAAAGAGDGRLQGGAAKRRRARCAFFPRRCRARRRPALQPRAGTCTWHRARQSRWSSARAARRSALRCATPPRPFRQTAKSQNFGFIESTNRGHPLIFLVGTFWRG